MDSQAGLYSHRPNFVVGQDMSSVIINTSHNKTEAPTTPIIRPPSQRTSRPYLYWSWRFTQAGSYVYVDEVYLTTEYQKYNIYILRLTEQLGASGVLRCDNAAPQLAIRDPCVNRWLVMSRAASIELNTPFLYSLRLRGRLLLQAV